LLEKAKEIEKILLENQKFQDEVTEMKSMVEKLKQTSEAIDSRPVSSGYSS